MQKRSSISAEVRFLDRDAVLADLRHAVAEARAQYPEIVKVYLFGSLADGTWTADSDADLMIVVRAQFKNFGDSCRYQIYADSIPADSLVYSEGDFTRMASDPESFVARNLVGAIEL